MNEFPIDRTTQNTPLDAASANSVSLADLSASTTESFGQMLLQLNSPAPAQIPKQRETDNLNSETEKVQTFAPADDRANNSQENETAVQTEVSPDRDQSSHTTDEQQAPATEASETEATETEVTEAEVTDESPNSDDQTTTENEPTDAAVAAELPSPLDASEVPIADVVDSADVAPSVKLAIETESVSEESSEKPSPLATGPIHLATDTEAQAPSATSQKVDVRPTETKAPDVATQAVTTQRVDEPDVPEAKIPISQEDGDSDAAGKAAAKAEAKASNDEGADNTSAASATAKGFQSAVPVEAAALSSESTLSADRSSNRRKTSGRQANAASQPTLSANRSAALAQRTAADSLPDILNSIEGKNADASALLDERPEGDSAKPSTRENNEPKPATVARLQRAMARQSSVNSAESKTEVQVDRVRFVERVARAFQTATRRGSEQIRLRLSPPSLGSLNLEVTMKGGELTARIEAETNSARTLLLDNLATLRDRLAEEGIKIEQFDVDLMDRQRDGFDDPTDRDASGRRSQHDDPSENESEDDATTRRSALTNEQNEDGKLDVVI